jgi:hypothetical protein
MERGTVVHGHECHQLIMSGEGFVRFKVPGKEIYEFFLAVFASGDCWEWRLKQRK